jgi:hypothetical protein
VDWTSSGPNIKNKSNLSSELRTDNRALSPTDAKEGMTSDSRKKLDADDLKKLLPTDCIVDTASAIAPKFPGLV